MFKSFSERTVHRVHSADRNTHKRPGPFSSNQLFLIKYKSNVGLKSYYDCFAMFLFNLKFLVCVCCVSIGLCLSYYHLDYFQERVMFKKGCVCPPDFN